MASRNSTLSQAIRTGGRFYFDNPNLDQVLAMLLTLSGEVWVLRERLAALESVAERKQLVGVGELDSHSFSDAEEAQLSALRKEFLASLFGVLETPRPLEGRSASKRLGTKRAARKRAAAGPKRVKTRKRSR
jgi:hypothetical protein